MGENSLLKIILRLTTLKKQNHSESSLSTYVYAKAYRKLVILTKRNIKDTILVVAGIFFAAFGLEGFLLSNGFIDGGATGISLLIANLADIPFSS